MKDFDYLLKLAALNINPEEKDRLEKEIFRIIEYFEELKKLDTEGVIPLISSIFFISPLTLREDEPKIFPERESILEAFSEREGDFLKTPPIEEPDAPPSPSINISPINV